MALTPLILLFFGCLLVIFLAGRLLGYIIGLDKYFRNDMSETPQAQDSSRKGRRNGIFFL